MSDAVALAFYTGVVYLAFVGAVAFRRDNPLTKGFMRVLAVAFLVLVVEYYRIGPL